MNYLGNEVVSRQEMRTARFWAANHLISYMDLGLANGQTHKLPVVNLGDALTHSISQCAAFRQEFERAMAQGRGGRDNPWCLILYLDEATPGNVLRLDNQRKVLLWYAGFLEMGPFLRSEHAWLPVAVVRTSLLKTVQGG